MAERWEPPKTRAESLKPESYPPLGAVRWGIDQQRKPVKYVHVGYGVAVKAPKAPLSYYEGIRTQGEDLKQQEFGWLHYDTREQAIEAVAKMHESDAARHLHRARQLREPCLSKTLPPPR